MLKVCITIDEFLRLAEQITYPKCVHHYYNVDCVTRLRDLLQHIAELDPGPEALPHLREALKEISVYTYKRGDESAHEGHFCGSNEDVLTGTFAKRTLELLQMKHKACLPDEDRPETTVLLTEDDSVRNGHRFAGLPTGSRKAAYEVTGTAGARRATPAAPATAEQSVVDTQTCFTDLTVLQTED
eukprot:TRINITY_DN10132_c0_g1_i1.p1 TRINITY_DN10132_c0_g1~~TRINITY_DN10132_c0_g1_i1.p1  ORF type:complete len:185 (+),score=30.14 TRINITY_DN10132_c0_g1_i1:477-1031(+)